MYFCMQTLPNRPEGKAWEDYVVTKAGIIIALTACITFMSPILHADQQERATAAFKYATAIVKQYGNTNDEQTLFNADRIIERAWLDLRYYYGTESELARDLALIRARSATSRADKRRVTKAWQTALRLQPRNLPRARRLALNIQAANATARVGDVRASSQYFAAARTYAFSPDRSTKILQLELRIQELRALGGQMEWRRLRDNLLDMRLFSEGFSLWTIPRLNALVSEAELRLTLQPEGEEKRNALSDLKTKIQLMMKGMGQLLTPTYVNRVRDFYYAIEDGYDL